LVVLAATIFRAMLQLITILNRCHHFRGFVYQQARFSSDHKSIEITVRPRTWSCPRVGEVPPNSIRRFLARTVLPTINPA
jgi:hypothetical protein